ncbi:MAG: Brp/Blh family beta-carotene 15,15'-dioxygenase [Phycisphaerae bacterium]
MTWFLLAALLALSPLSLTLQLTLLLAGVALLGMPHGAMDHRVGERVLRPLVGGAWPALFAVGYLGLAGGVVLVWQVAPYTTLVAFLGISAVHFGLGDVEGLRGSRTWLGFEAVARGCVPVLLPVAFWPVQVAELFSWVLPPGRFVAHETLAAVAPWLAWPVLAGAAAVAAVCAARRRWQTSLEVLTLGVSAYLLPPLAAFTLYFCLWHSARHLLDLAAWRGDGDVRRGTPRLLREAVPMTLLTLAAMAVAAVYLLPGYGIPATLVHVTFVALSALTAPHMLLTAWAHAKPPPTPPLDSSATVKHLAGRAAAFPPA